jgi:hypothetical protein
MAVDATHSTVGNGPLDYFQINSQPIRTTATCLCPHATPGAAYKIDRSTGAVFWRLGGKRSDFSMGASSSFAWQYRAARRWRAYCLRCRRSLDDSPRKVRVPTTG